LGDAGSKGKYLDRLIYDANRIYNFNLKPGRIMGEISIFELKVELLNSDNYSRVVTVQNPNHTGDQNENYVWFPLIGDSILSFNFFSGTGVNAGFAMIDILLKALTQLFPVSNSIYVFPNTGKQREKKISDAGYTPGAFGNLSPYLQKEIVPVDFEHLKLPVDEDQLQDRFDVGELELFSDSTRAPNLQILVDSYKLGLDLDIDTASFDTDGIPGMDRLMSANTIFSYLNYSTMIDHCNGDPEDFNRLKQLDKEAGIDIEMVDLDYPDDSNSTAQYDKHDRLYTKSVDRFCLVSYGVGGSDGL